MIIYIDIDETICITPECRNYALASPMKSNIEKVRELAQYQAEESFISIPWNGKDQAGRKIANGAYFYHVKAEKDGNIMFEDIFKLAKVE